MFNILEIIILKGTSIYWLLKDKTEIFFFRFMRLLSLVFLEQHFDLKEVTFCCSRKCGDEKIEAAILPYCYYQA